MPGNYSRVNCWIEQGGLPTLDLAKRPAAGGIRIGIVLNLGKLIIVLGAILVAVGLLLLLLGLSAGKHRGQAASWVTAVIGALCPSGIQNRTEDLA